MKWSEFFIPTAKESPADAVVPSHQLMIRAGMIRQVVAGAYTYLPLGYRTLRKIEAIVREEMNRAGAIELHMPAMHPIEWWEETGRVAAMGDVLVRLGGGPGDDWRSRTVLGPTHEEVITEHARAFLNSYKQLPVNFYQIQTKFRGEARPKSGVLRTREFLMKDAYSFHLTKEGPGGLDEGYQKMYDAYCAIFSRCGLPYIIVEAESGPIGGDASHEFMVPTDAGEDWLVQAEDGCYAANLERAEVAPIVGRATPALSEPRPSGSGHAARRSDEGAAGHSVPRVATSGLSEPRPLGSDHPGTPAPNEVHTPGLMTIDDVSRFLKCEPSQMIKTIIYEANGEPLVALVRGDHEVNEAKLRRAARSEPPTSVGADVHTRLSGAQAPPPVARGGHGGGEPGATAGPKGATGGSPASSQSVPRAEASGPAPLNIQQAGPDLIRKVTGAEVGFAGPVGLNARYIVDQAVSVMHDAVIGANKTDYHLMHVEPGRDFALTHVADIRTAVPGDRAPSGSPLQFKKCIEIGHVFKLGAKYSQAMGATCLDHEGKARPFIMGCYGIGVNRIMAAAIESFHDEKGIQWPMSIAPFQVVICALDVREQQVVSLAQKLHDELEAAGIDVLLDDRDARPGFKFADADLIGFPIRIVVGKKGLAEGVVELHTRSTGETQKLAPQQVVHATGKTAHQTVQSH